MTPGQQLTAVSARANALMEAALDDHAKLLVALLDENLLQKVFRYESKQNVQPTSKT